MVVKEKEKQLREFYEYIRRFAFNDSYTNDKQYNYGRRKIMNNIKIDSSDPLIKYYCMCNNLQLKDIPRRNKYDI